MALVIAHRGSHQRAPENTLAAFAEARAHGADMVELDVRRTADGQLAIFHDSELAATSLNRLTLKELRQAAGVEVPVLEEVLAWAEASGMGLDVELKEDGYVDVVAPLLLAFDGPLIVTSFIDPVLSQLAEHGPALARGLLLSFTAMGAAGRVSDCDGTAAIIEMKLLDERVLEQVAEAGLGAYVWDFDPSRADHAGWLAHPLIDGFITDDVPGTRTALALRA